MLARGRHHTTVGSVQPHVGRRQCSHREKASS